MPDEAVLVRPLRPPRDNIPQTRQQRDALLQAVAEYVERERPVSPLSIDELRIHAGAVLKAERLDEKYLDYAAVLVSNEVWRPTVARIPYSRRLLLLPQCLRSSEECPATFDEIGLVCEHCGRCAINEFKRQAERLGYAVLVAEGSPVVMSLIETGQIEAVVGVSCLSVLERVFPYMEAGAVPGVATPLLRDGCADTAVDVILTCHAVKGIVPCAAVNGVIAAKQGIHDIVAAQGVDAVVADTIEQYIRSIRFGLARIDDDIT